MHTYEEHGTTLLRVEDGPPSWSGALLSLFFDSEEGIIGLSAPACLQSETRFEVHSVRVQN